MQQKRSPLATCLGILLLALLPASVTAQGSDTYTVGVMVGLGGSNEDEPDPGLDNFTWQALFTMKIDSSTQWGVRLGQLELDTGEALSTSDLNFATVSGEYRFADDIIDSGLYLGLGFYDFDGGPALGDDTALGAVLGVVGEVEMRERWSLLLDFSGHYADLDHTQFFFMGHIGFGYHF